MRKATRQGMSLVMMFLVVTLPMAMALEISNVRVENIQQTSADIAWETDQPADGYVSYGVQQEQLETIGDAIPQQEHRFTLRNLLPEMTYFFTVQSNEVVNDRGGSFHSFTTLPPDREAPTINVTIPPRVQGEKIDITGTTEADADVSLTVNGQIVRTVTADELGSFSFSDIVLVRNEENTITLEARDAAGNSGSFTATVFADVEPPVISLRALPEVVAESTLPVKATISEESTIQLFVNDRSVAELQGTAVDQQVDLQEGDNVIRIVARDAAGWETVQEVHVLSDSQPPRVQFTLVSGTEYFEGRAETDVSGQTEAGATVFLYVFRGTSEVRDFDHALQKATADAEGKFTFEDVTFPPSVLSSLQRLRPKEVPAGLQEIVVSPAERFAEEQRQAYKVVVIAEDRTGKVGYEEKSVNINTCFAGEFSFTIEPLAQFQAPFRLNPSVMEDGRETIQAVFNLTYRGNAVAFTEPMGGVGGINGMGGDVFGFGGVPLSNKPYQIVSSPQFTKACTRETAESDDYKLGCQLLPARMNVQSNADKTAFYVTGALQKASEFLKKEDNAWDDFVSKRQLKFPLRVTLSYQERVAIGGWSETKTQVFCQDLAYFVDVPVDSEDLVPDFLANEGVQALNATINQIEQVKPYLETAMIATGVGCVGSFLTKLVTRFYRIFISNFETWTRRAAVVGEDKKCPSSDQQQGLYTKDTIAHWKELKNRGGTIPPESGFPATIDTLDPEKDSLEARCPATASAWSLEEFFDKTYRWTCDRFLCRSVPAGWTAGAEKVEVDNVQLRQLQCTASTNCANTLVKVENCQEELKKNPAYGEVVRAKQDRGEGSFSCWRDAEGTYYYRCTLGDLDGNCAKDIDELEVKGIWRLKPVLGIGQSKPYQLVLNPGNAGQLCAAVDRSCDTMCKSKGNYKGVSDGYKLSDGKMDSSAVAGSCYEELSSGSRVALQGKGQATIDQTKIQAGYTRDCFIDEDSGKKYQCVCEQIQKPTLLAQGVRTAMKAQNGVAEKWLYREARVYEESLRTRGTYYPEWRYYDGRDYSAAFGLDAGLDNFVPDTETSKKSSARVDPHNQYVGSFQTMCLTTINAHLNMLQSTLIGLQKCIVEAKHTGVQDAGLCKTLFTQYVCGLVYKGIAYLGSQCSPLSLKDMGADYSQTGVPEFFGSAFNAIPQAIETSAEEVNSDYGNAQFRNFFRSGAQGFAESMCLAAFGYDFPMGMDFIQDAAQAASTKVDVIFPVAERELVTFDPVRGTAVHNYELGGVLFPGCRVRGYRTELKCIGFEDLNKPGVDPTCGGKGCDCVNVQQPEFSGERVHLVEGGTNFGGVTKHHMHDLPIPSPQRVSANYRYDHVVFHVLLDPLEDPKNCFDQGYDGGNGEGIFYFSIQDVSPPGVLSCSVRPETGKFVCPQISSLFGGGETYFEYPYMECYDKAREEFVNCQQPNVFIFGDPLVIKPYINVGNQKACLKIRDATGKIEIIKPLEENVQGLFSPRLNLGTASPELIGNVGSGTIRNVAGSAPGCGGNGGDVQIVGWPGSGQSVSSRQLPFRFTVLGSGKYQLEVPVVVTVEPGVDEQGRARYSKDANDYLTFDGRVDLTREEINTAVFTIDGFRFTQVLGSAVPTSGASGVCSYETLAALGSGIRNQRGTVHLTAELLQPDAGGNCFSAMTPVQTSSLGLPRVQVPIPIQAQYVQQLLAEDLHEDFERGNYEGVEQKAQVIVTQQQTTLADALALYYWIAALVMDGNGVGKNQVQIRSLLDVFYGRRYGGDVTGGIEYGKVFVYLCQIDGQMGNQHAAQCQAGVNGASATACETNAQYKNTHSCLDTTSWSSKSNCVSNLCENTILTARGVSNPNDWMCCPVTTCEKDSNYKNTHKCQDTKTRSNGNTGCVANLCENGVLTARGITNPNEWMCCPT